MSALKDSVSIKSSSVSCLSDDNDRRKTTVKVTAIAAKWLGRFLYFKISISNRFINIYTITPTSRNGTTSIEKCKSYGLVASIRSNKPDSTSRNVNNLFILDICTV